MTSLIEKYDSGIRRIINAFKNHGSPSPVFENFQQGFRVTVFSRSSENVTENRISLIMTLVKENSKITTTEISEKLM